MSLGATAAIFALLRIRKDLGGIGFPKIFDIVQGVQHLGLTVAEHRATRLRSHHHVRPELVDLVLKVPIEGNRIRIMETMAAIPINSPETRKTNLLFRPAVLFRAICDNRT